MEERSYNSSHIWVKLQSQTICLTLQKLTFHFLQNAVCSQDFKFCNIMVFAMETLIKMCVNTFVNYCKAILNYFVVLGIFHGLWCVVLGFVVCVYCTLGRLLWLFSDIPLAHRWPPHCHFGHWEVIKINTLWRILFVYVHLF